MKKVILFLVCLLSVSKGYASSGCADCRDVEGHKAFIPEALSRTLVPLHRCEVTISYENLHMAERAFLRHAHLSAEEPSEGFEQTQKDHLHKTVAQRLMMHPSLQEAHLTFEMGEHVRYYCDALSTQLFNVAGASQLRTLSLDITSLAGLCKSEVFIHALLKSPNLEEVNLFNIHMGEDETFLMKFLEVLSLQPNVKNLGLYEVPASLGGISKLRLTGGVLSKLALKQYETLTLDTLGVRGIEECFIAYIRGLKRPQTLRVKGDIYVDHSRAGFIRTALRGYGDKYKTFSGKLFAFCPIINTYKEIKDTYAR